MLITRDLVDPANRITGFQVVLETVSEVMVWDQKILIERQSLNDNLKLQSEIGLTGINYEFYFKDVNLRIKELIITWIEEMW